MRWNGTKKNWMNLMLALSLLFFLFRSFLWTTSGFWWTSTSQWIIFLNVWLFTICFWRTTASSFWFCAIWFADACWTFRSLIKKNNFFLLLEMDDLRETYLCLLFPIETHLRNYDIDFLWTTSGLCFRHYDLKEINKKKTR